MELVDDDHLQVREDSVLDHDLPCRVKYEESMSALPLSQPN